MMKTNSSMWAVLILLQFSLVCPVGAAGDSASGPFQLNLELQRRDPQTEETTVTHEEVAAARTAIVLVDVWDYHWCTTWCGRAGTMIPRMNQVLEVARKLGITVVHSPTDCSAGQAGLPQRERMAALPYHPKPEPLAVLQSPIPWGFGLDGGCMCGGPYPCVVNYFNYRQDQRLLDSARRLCLQR